MIEQHKHGRLFQYRRIAPPRNPHSQGAARFGRWEYRVPRMFLDWREVLNLTLCAELDETKEANNGE